MVLDDVLSFMEEKIFSASLKNDSLFNQYNDRNLELDLPNADKIRRKNLYNYLSSFSERPPVILIGEAPGYLGCRFSGVPFTSEAQLCNGSLPFVGAKSSKRQSPYKERTATIFWENLRIHHPKFFVWNCIPFHPHKRDKLLSNRTPTNIEITTYLKLLSEIVELIKPIRIVAIGKSAERALKNIDITPIYVRHPSCGGANEFRAGMEKTLAIL